MRNPAAFSSTRFRGFLTKRRFDGFYLGEKVKCVLYCDMYNKESGEYAHTPKIYLGIPGIIDTNYYIQDSTWKEREKERERRRKREEERKGTSQRNV